MARKILFHEAYQQIIDTIEEKIIYETRKGGVLEDIVDVVRGDAQRGRPRCPALWIVPGTAKLVQGTTTLQEVYKMDIHLISVVQNSKNPKDGQKLSAMYASLARSVILKDRQLGLRGIVQDVKSLQFLPQGNMFDVEGSSFSATAVLEVTFKILE